MRASLAGRWDEFWFEPTPAIGLAICRVLFYGAFFAYFLRIDYTELAALPTSFWQPMWPFRSLGPGVPSAAVLNLLQWIWRASLVASCLGFATRWSTAAAFALGLYLIGLTENVSKINHSDAIVVWGLAVMALSRCADALSVDAWLGRTARRADNETGDYTWPVRVMWLVFVTIYFSAGITKLTTSGLAWVTSDHLSNLLVFGPVTGAPLTRLGQELGRHQRLSSLAAGLALTLELSMPLALVSRHARQILVPCLFVMQFFIRALLGPGFTEFFICGLFWIPWSAIVERFTHGGSLRSARLLATG
jgi:vitamin K-dependent gamma-carboxylase-like protein